MKTRRVALKVKKKKMEAPIVFYRRSGDEKMYVQFDIFSEEANKCSYFQLCDQYAKWYV